MSECYTTPYTLSPIIELSWLGWRTNTRQMSQYGWEWMIEKNEYDMSFIIFCQHKRDCLKGISNSIDVSEMQRRCYNENVGLVEMSMYAHVEAPRHIIFEPVSMIPLNIDEGVVRRQSIEFFDVSNFFKTEKWMGEQVSKNKRREIKLQPETLKRRLDIANR